MAKYKYKTERGLVRQFVEHLRSARSPWGNVEVSREFSYQRGRVDVVALAGKGTYLIAFEAKLKEWRYALHQAYRNRCLAHLSYVVLPKNTAIVAQRYEAEFKLRNVGLCYCEAGNVGLIFSPKRELPLEPWLLQEATAATRRQSGAPK